MKGKVLWAHRRSNALYMRSIVTINEELPPHLRRRRQISVRLRKAIRIRRRRRTNQATERHGPQAAGTLSRSSIRNEKCCKGEKDEGAQRGGAGRHDPARGLVFVG